jgi:hypothetical protein
MRCGRTCARNLTTSYSDVIGYTGDEGAGRVHPAEVEKVIGEVEDREGHGDCGNASSGSIRVKVAEVRWAHVLDRF